MYLIYFDESKYQKSVNSVHIYGALAIPGDSCLDVEKAVQAVAERFYKEEKTDKEIHAYDIIQGRGHAKGTTLEDRVTLFAGLAKVLSQSGLNRVEIKVYPDRMKSEDYDDMAVMFMIERCDMLMASKKSTGLLIGDLDQEKLNTVPRAFLKYRQGTTHYQYGRKIAHLVDTIHFTDSRKSRLIQLADVYTMLLKIYEDNKDKSPFREIRREIKRNDYSIFPTKYKHWPEKSA